MNDSKNQNVVEPTGLMGTQFALNIAQGVIDAIIEAEVSKSELASWDQKELRMLSKKATQKFLGLKSKKIIDPWIGEKVKILNFYGTCFKDTEWQNPIFWADDVLFPEIKGEIKRPEYIFPKMNPVIDVAFDAYADFFGKDKAWKAWKKIADAMDYLSIQSRPDKDYIVLHVGGDEPDLLNYSYDDGIEQNIIFLTPLEGIIAAFRHRFETGKIYDVVGITRLSALVQDGRAMSMCKGHNGGFRVGSLNRGNHDSSHGLRQACFKPF